MQRERRGEVSRLRGGQLMRCVRGGQSVTAVRRPPSAGMGLPGQEKGGPLGSGSRAVMWPHLFQEENLGQDGDKDPLQGWRGGGQLEEAGHVGWLDLEVGKETVCVSCWF